VLDFLDTKKQESEMDAERKWITTWNYYLNRLKLFLVKLQVVLYTRLDLKYISILKGKNAVDDPTYQQGSNPTEPICYYIEKNPCYSSLLESTFNQFQFNSLNWF
jgi:hypothetical protein